MDKFFPFLALLIWFIVLLAMCLTIIPILAVMFLDEDGLFFQFGKSLVDKL
jgi:hypothetical protein